jgi:hypothetical protein
MALTSGQAEMPKWQASALWSLPPYFFDALQLIPSQERRRTGLHAIQQLKPFAPVQPKIHRSHSLGGIQPRSVQFVRHHDLPLSVTVQFPFVRVIDEHFVPAGIQAGKPIRVK